jgi:hypothetical protein
MNVGSCAQLDLSFLIAIVPRRQHRIYVLRAEIGPRLEAHRPQCCLETVYLRRIRDLIV